MFACLMCTSQNICSSFEGEARLFHLPSQWMKPWWPVFAACSETGKVCVWAFVRVDLNSLIHWEIIIYRSCLHNISHWIILACNLVHHVHFHPIWHGVLIIWKSIFFTTVMGCNRCFGIQCSRALSRWFLMFLIRMPWNSDFDFLVILFLTLVWRQIDFLK